MVVAAIVFFVVGAGLRLLWGPVSLGPLRGTLAGAIHEALPGINLDYDQAAIEWSRDQGRVNLVVLGARIFDSHGRIVAQRAQGRHRSGGGALPAGPVRDQAHHPGGRAIHPGAHEEWRASGWATEKDAGDDDVIGRISDVDQRAQHAPSSLESFAVRNARLAFYDEVTGLQPDRAARQPGAAVARAARSAPASTPM